MRIRALEAIKHDPLYLAEGDEITVEAEVGEYLVGNGWAMNVETGEVGEREGGEITLDVPKANHGHSASEV